MKNALNQEVEGLFVGQLIDLLIERKEGYLQAAEKIGDPYLKQLFTSHSQFSNLLIQELLHHFTIECSTFECCDWKQWNSMPRALKTKHREDLLEACISGEQNLVYFYMEVLKTEPLIPELRPILEKQLSQVRSACDTLKIFKICL